MRNEELSYSADIPLKGYLAQPEGSEKCPAVIVAHTWRGLDHFARNKAEELAKLGYIGFAADLYGDGRTAKDDEEAFELMSPLFVDRKLLRQRIVAAYKTISNHPNVDRSKIFAIGFCFGGLTCIELFRSGVDIHGVVSFHGVLGSALGGLEAVTLPPVTPIKGAILLLHGYLDPLVSSDDLNNIQKEFSDYGVDWQLDIYGRATHAFTNPEANSKEHGMLFDAQTSKRAWIAMENFLKEKTTPEVL